MDLNAVHDSIRFRIRQALGDRFKESFFFLKPIEFQRRQEDSGGFPILGDHDRMSGITQTIQPGRGLGFEGAESHHIFG